MRPITIRMPDETVKFVRGLAARRGTDESTVWRELTFKGMLNVQQEQRPDAALLNYLIQTLCLTRRLVEHVDDSLVTLADDDARSALADMSVSNTHENNTHQSASNSHAWNTSDD